MNGLNIEAEGVDKEVKKGDNDDNEVVMGVSGEEVLLVVLVGDLEP